MSENFAEMFGSLDISPSDEPLPEITRQRDDVVNPFGQPILASIANETPYSVYVPEAGVTRCVSLLNAAAKKENVGVRVVVNVQRDDKGKVVKGADGKAVAIVEKRGENKGKVLVRFQGRPERKQQSAPRPFSIVNDPDNTSGKMVKERETGEIVARGTHDEMRAVYAERTEAWKQAHPQQ